jgi:catechol 2,3-dioxygenase-like lactoylglutathione lyase family enzyme
MSSSSPFAAVDHVGFVVASLDEALDFFVDILGFERVAGRHGTLGFPDGDRMTRLFGVAPEATARFAFLRLGGSVIELLEWDAPGREQRPPLNSDAGGRHLALQVADMAAALDRLRAVPGVAIREPNDRGYVYAATPFGLELQLIPG